MEQALTLTPEDEVALPRAAQSGAVRAGLATFALIGHVPLWLGPVFAWAAMAFRGALAPGVAEFSLLTLTYLAPLFAAGVVHRASRDVLVREAQASPHRGRAAAAGACLAMTAVSLAVTAAGHLWVGNPTFLEVGSQLLAIALGVGYYGAWAFETVAEQDRQGDSSRDVPALYQGFAAAGLAGPVLLAGGVAWGALSVALPFLSPWWLAAALRSLVAPVPSFLLATGVAVAGVAPLSWAAARGMRRRFPRGSKKALAVGLLLPPLLPLVAFATRFIAGIGWAVTPEVWWATLVTMPVLYGFAFGLHGGFVAAGLAGGPRRAALPGGAAAAGEPARLPAVE